MRGADGDLSTHHPIIWTVVTTSSVGGSFLAANRAAIIVPVCVCAAWFFLCICLLPGRQKVERRVMGRGKSVAGERQ